MRRKKVASRGASERRATPHRAAPHRGGLALGARRAMQKHRKNGGLVARVILGVALAALLGAPGCGSAKSANTEAAEVLEAISRLDPGAPPAARKQALDEVAALPVTEPAVDALRAVCLEAHRGLLEAELVQAEVKRSLDGEPPPAPEQLAALAAKMQGAEATLAAAHAALARCEARSREATVKYR